MFLWLVRLHVPFSTSPAVRPHLLPPSFLLFCSYSVLLLVLDHCTTAFSRNLHWLFLLPGMPSSDAHVLSLLWVSTARDTQSCHPRLSVYPLILIPCFHWDCLWLGLDPPTFLSMDNSLRSVSSLECMLFVGRDFGLLLAIPSADCPAYRHAQHIFVE